MLEERVLERPLERFTERTLEMALERSVERPLYLSEECLLGLVFMHNYRFLTIPQFARVSSLSLPYARRIGSPSKISSEDR